MGFRLIKETTTIDFVGLRRTAYIISLLMLLLGVGGIVWSGGLHYGVDFAGGVMVQVQFQNPVADEDVKGALQGLNMPGLTVQQYGANDQDYMLRFSATNIVTETLRADVSTALTLPGNEMTIQRVEMVGPKVGEDLRNMALEALFYSVLLITVYISGRFEKRWFIAAAMAAVLWGGIYVFSLLGLGRVWEVFLAMLVTMVVCYQLRLNFALGAIVALIHDVIITVGLLTLMGKEIDLNIIAALLTLVGYSLNDTIIVYDRIRENLQKVSRDEPSSSMGVIINLSVNQTLSRTILTSGTTLMACLSLFVLGGSVIHDFSLTMLMGIIVGTYSSVFVASPILLAFGDTALYLNQQSEPVAFEKPGEHGMV